MAATDLSHAFGLLAGIIALLSYVFYFQQILRGQSTPNPSTWAIWLLVGIINTFTYFLLVQNDIWQSLTALAVVLSVLIIFIYSIIKGKFSRISTVEIVTFIFALGIGIFWQITSNYRVSNILLQVIYLLSNVPTIVGIVRGTGREHYVSWSTAFVAYVCAIISLLLNYQGDWVAFVFPVVNGLIGNGVVVTFILLKKAKRHE